MVKLANEVKRPTIVDLGEAYARLRSFTIEMFSDGRISRETMVRHQEELKMLIQQATDHPTARLTGRDL